MGLEKTFFVVILVGCAFGNIYHELYTAAISGNIQQVKTAIANGADVDWRNPYFLNFTALLAVCERPNINGPEIVSLLLEAGADPNVATNNYRTPLILAARHQSNATVATAITQLLLEAGANVSLGVSLNGRTALHEAAWYNLTEVALLLLEAGADPQAKDYNGKTPSDVGRRNNRLKLAQLIESYSSATTHILPHFTAIMFVAVTITAITQLT